METRGKSIAGLVLAVIGIIVTGINCWTAGVFWFLGLLALACGVVGIILAAMGMKENERVYGAVIIGYPANDSGLPNRKLMPQKGNEITFIE